MINVGLAASRELTPEAVRDLIALHVAMDIMVASMNQKVTLVEMPKGARKTLKQAVRQLEYQMQDIWGFPRDKKNHTHWKRFTCFKKSDAGTTRS